MPKSIIMTSQVQFGSKMGTSAQNYTPLAFCSTFCV